MSDKISIDNYGISAFPAASSPNGGNLNLEYNVSTLSRATVSRNFYINGLSLYNNSGYLAVHPGKCYVDGYIVETFDDYDLEQISNITFPCVLFMCIQYSGDTDSLGREHLTGSPNADPYDGVYFYLQDGDSLTISATPSIAENLYVPIYYLPDNDLSNAVQLTFNNTKLKSSEIFLGHGSTVSNKTGTDNDIKITGFDGSVTSPTTLQELIDYLNSTYIRRFYNSGINSGNTEYRYGKLEVHSSSSSPSSDNPYVGIDGDGIEFYTNSKTATLGINSNKMTLDLSELGETSLEITGTLKADRVYGAVYNDYAELYEKDDINEVILPGDIIELNPKTGKYRKCQNYMSSLVVGVCSDSYGHLLGGDKDLSVEENLKKYIPVGLIGRVYVKIDDKYIEPGDLLISTDAGTAVRARLGKDCTGTIIGKSLSYPENGKVLMQIMLQ